MKWLQINFKWVLTGFVKCQRNEPGFIPLSYIREMKNMSGKLHNHKGFS
jgi:hypothetical protein